MPVALAAAGTEWTVNNGMLSGELKSDAKAPNTAYGSALNRTHETREGGVQSTRCTGAWQQKPRSSEPISQPAPVITGSLGAGRSPALLVFRGNRNPRWKFAPLRNPLELKKVK